MGLTTVQRDCAAYDHIDNSTARRQDISLPSAYNDKVMLTFRSPVQLSPIWQAT